LDIRNIAIVCGGFSGEYEISMQSAILVDQHLDKEKYNPYLIVIEQDRWFYKSSIGEEFNIDKNDFSLTLPNELIKFDGVFIAIHGTPGEDGKLQAYFDMLGLPYTSCGADSAALTFNKFYCNAFIGSYGISMARSLSFVKTDIIETEFVIDKLGLPLFVKPARSGSSVGISKVNNKNDFEAAIQFAFAEDSRILVEEFLKGREIACGLLKNGPELIVFPLTEIISKNDFFDYEAKYTAGMANEICPATNISEEVEQDVKALSSFLFRQLD
jgi:D-alanine-D-alanine ligase